MQAYAIVIRSAFTDILPVFPQIDTIGRSLFTWLYAMARFPAVLKAAQDEVDRVCGPERGPTLDDFAAMPYVCLMVKEALRWQTRVSMAHRSTATEDDEYMGYRIPAVSTTLSS